MCPAHQQSIAASMQAKDRRWLKTDAGHQHQLGVATKALELQHHINASQMASRMQMKVPDPQVEVQHVDQGQAVEEKQEIKEELPGRMEAR